jgi:RNA recognition motif-containing protein
MTAKKKMMTKRLSVVNLPHHMTEEQLQTLFSEAGLVASAKVITYLHNGQTRGFGFVSMQTREEGQKAISLFNGRVVGGRPIAVKAEGAQSRSPFGRRSRNCR